MPTARLLFSSAWLLLGLAAAGCASGAREARIGEHAAKFAALPADAQRHVRSGNVDHGFDPDTVYMALGRPSRVTRSAEPAGAETWSYRNYVFGASSAATLTMAAPGGFSDPSRVAGSAAGRGASVPARAANTAPSVTLDTSANGVGTLHLDFVDGRVARIRLEPY